MLILFSIERDQYIWEFKRQWIWDVEGWMEGGQQANEEKFGKTPNLDAGLLPHHLNLCQIQKK